MKQPGLIEQLQEEIRCLRKENEQLRMQLDLTVVPTAQKLDIGAHMPVSNAHVLSMHSDTNKKVSLFRSLFCGRMDVYAQRWYSEKTNKSGYSPVCRNEWMQGLCDKRHVKCRDCPNRELLPLNDQAIYTHLVGNDPNGRDVVGIYPMLLDETTRLLAMDFDGDGWKTAVSCIRNLCQQYEIPVFVERSRSGDGAHVWFFFAMPIPAKDARRFGSGLLTQAMQRGSIPFASYDRLFPNQDTLPTGGFGNLIALPLQGLARKNGNSLFIDAQFMPYTDQWTLLSQVKRIHPEQLAKWTELLCSFGDLGVLLENDEESVERPWTKTVPVDLTCKDFYSSVVITRANMLYISKAVLSAAARNRIIRLASFKNPDFQKTQAMRLPTYDKPRIICTAEETKQYIALPRGCEDALVSLLAAISAPYGIVDETHVGSPIRVTFTGILRDEQNYAAEKMLQHNTGVLSAGTAFGKTVVGAYLIAQRKTNTLILVHTQALLAQWKAALDQFLLVEEKLPELPKRRGRCKERSIIGQYGAGKDTRSGVIDIAILQSVCQKGEVKPFVRDYGMVLVDECHHVPAVGLERVLKEIAARYVYGLTATPIRQDGHQAIIYMQCGEIRYRTNALEQAIQHSFQHYMIPRFTSFRQINEDKVPIPISETYAQLCESVLRNQMIVQDVQNAVKEGRTPIVLTERQEHALRLFQLLQSTCIHCFLLTGRGGVREKREKLIALKKVPADEPLLIVATGKYIGEGFDEPRLDTLFLALPIAWKGTLSQYVGRLHRNYEGKLDVCVFDYVDARVPVLERMYHKRMRGYAALGYQTSAIDDTALQLPGVLFDAKSFTYAFEQDVISARHSVVICSPFVQLSRYRHMEKLLIVAQQNSARVTIQTRPPENYSQEDGSAIASALEMAHIQGFHVITKPGFHQKFSLIDGRIVWYGSVNLLSLGKLEETMMRIESAAIASQLHEEIE